MPRKSDEPIQRTSVHLTKAQVAALRRITEATGVPAAFLIRQGVDWVIEQRSKDVQQSTRRAKR